MHNLMNVADLVSDVCVKVCILRLRMWPILSHSEQYV